MAIYMKIEGVDGESQDVGYEDTIKLQSINYGIDSAVSPGGTGHSGGRVTLAPLQLNTVEGRHSIEFFKRCANGTHFPQIKIFHTKQTGDATQQTYKEVTLDVVYVSHQSISGGDADSYESLMLNADKITIDYKAQDASGALTSVGLVEYDSRTAQTA